MYYFINQIKKKDCSFASLKILLANIYKREDFLYILQNKEDKAYSLKDIINEATKYGVSLKGFKVEDENEINSFVSKPYLLVVNENGFLHMIVLLKIKNKYAIIADPNDDIRKIRLSELKQIWTKEFLEVEEVFGSDFKIKKEKNKNRKFVIFSILTKLLSFVSLSLGLFSCSKEVSFFIPVIYFVIFALLSLVDKIILIKGMKNFDQSVLTPSYLESKKNLESTMISMNNYKKITFSGPLVLFESAFVLILSIIMLGYNSYLNVINICLIALYQTFLYFVLYSYLKKKKKYVSALESKLINSNLADDEFKETLNILNKEAYNVAILFEVKKYLNIFISIILSMLLFGFNSTSGLNFVIFHTAFYYLINSYIEKIISYGSEVNIYKKYKCQYLNIVSSRTKG